MKKTRWPQRSIAERFWGKVDKDGPIPEHMPHLGRCWLWTGAKLQKPVPDGYGVFNRCQGQGTILAHVFAYQLVHGDPPPGVHVLHYCDCRPCVNPAHLWLGTQADNVADMDAKGRRRTKATPGSGQPNSKLIEAQVLEIRRRTANGEAFIDLAREYGVDRALIRRIHLGRNWRHILPGARALGQDGSHPDEQGV